MKRIVLALGILTVLLAIGVHGSPVPMCSMSHAAEEAAQATATDVGTAIQSAIVGTVIPLVVAVVGALASLCLAKLKARYNLQLQAGTQAWIEEQAESVVQMVAEKAAASIKWDKVTLTNNDKLNIAIATLVSRIPKLTPEQADQYIHAAIARIKGEGATGASSAAT